MKIIKRIINKLLRTYDNITFPKLRQKGSNVVIERKRKIVNPHHIEIGNNVFIGSNSFIAANTEKFGQNFTPIIKIGNNVSATAMLQIHCMDKIIIEDDVLIATNVFMCDGSHGYYNGIEPYKNQLLFKIAPIRIGKGSWIGQNVVIMPGVNIGIQCIIGANSVVTKNIPDYCIAVGNPCVIKKKWNDVSCEWERK